MRIISGLHKGRKISPPAKMPLTRPTTDMAKEGLFNILDNNLNISSLNALDLFAGTGSIGYELASRGAKKVILVEKDLAMHQFINNNIEALQFTNLKCIKLDVFRYLTDCTEKFDFIFADPPYALPAIDQIPAIIFEKSLLNKNGWLVLEHTPSNDYRKYPYYKTERNYGSTIFSIFVQS